MKTLFLPVLLLTACISCHEPNKERFLQFNPAIDSVHHYIVETGLLQMQSNTSDTMWNSKTIRFSLQCVQKNDSLRTMKLVFEGIKVMEPLLSTTASEGQVTVTPVKGRSDTINTDNHLPAPVTATNNASLNTMRYSLYRALVGDSVDVIMDRQGQVIQVNGFDAVLDRVSHKAQIEKSMVKMSLRELAGPDAISDLLNQIFFFLPNKEISSGDDWVKNFVLTSRAPLKFSNRVSVGQIRNDSVSLFILSRISARTGEEGTLYEEGQQSGTMLLRKSTGMVLNYHAESATEYKTNSYTVVKKRLLKVRTG